MTRILDQMYGKFGITRLTEGGLVNNVGETTVEKSCVGRFEDGILLCLRLFFTDRQYVVSRSKNGCSQCARQHSACRSMFFLGRRLTQLMLFQHQSKR